MADRSQNIDHPLRAWAAPLVANIAFPQLPDHAPDALALTLF